MAVQPDDENSSRDSNAADDPGLDTDLRAIEEKLAGDFFDKIDSDDLMQLETFRKNVIPTEFGYIPKMLGKFKIIRTIGSGSQGVVCEALQTNLNRRVALKIVPSSGTNQGGYDDSILKEAEAGAKLHHPWIIPVFDFGKFENFYYIVQELVEKGRSLADYLIERKKKKPFSRSDYVEIATIFSQICDGLHHAHGNHVMGVSP